MLIEYSFPLAQQAVPQLDSVYWIMLASRILHILGAIILVGGLFYLWAVVTPSVPPDAARADEQFGGRRAAWAMWVGIASLLLLVPGLWNYWQMIQMHEKLAGSYHMIAGIKILLGLVLFFVAALVAGRSPAAQSLRRKLRFWLTLCLIIGILTAALGSVLRTFPRTPKLDAPPDRTTIAP
jgi:uncharacterized membrane protein